MRRYQEVLQTIQMWIDTGTLKPHDRLPSVRRMSMQSGYSAVTVQHAYALLESDGAIYAKPRSGFYVAEQPNIFADFPNVRKELVPQDVTGAAPSVLYQIMSSWRERGLQGFGYPALSPDLLPTEDMGIHFRRALREEAHRALDSMPFAGDPLLREFIAKRSAPRSGVVTADDVILTGSSQQALNMCLYVTTEPGDTVLIESPSYISLFTALKRRRLRALEIYSHPNTGIDLDQFRYLLDQNKVSACVLVPVHHFPTGVTYSEETMRGIVAIAAERNVSIIENDAYGELGYGYMPPPSLKGFDRDDTVLQFGSFSETLGPRYGLGWIINRRHQARLLEECFAENPQGGDVAMQRAILQYMQQRSYDRHLRRMRETLAARVRHSLSLISDSFPRNCSVSRPSGGFMCWLRAPSGFDSLKVAQAALHDGLSISPGSLFSVTGSFHNFTALNLSFPWCESRQQQLRLLSDLVVRRDKE